MNNFQRLPFEDVIVERIFSKLQPKDIIMLTETCRWFHEAVGQSDKTWRDICFREFGIRLPVSENGFARKLYKNVLHTYGHLLGFWTQNNRLLQITYSDGKLLCKRLEPPKIPNLMDPLRPYTIFTISMDESNDDRVVIQCKPHQHDCALHYVEKVLNGNFVSYLVRKCPEGPFGAIQQQEYYELEEQFRADRFDWPSIDDTDANVRFLRDRMYVGLLNEYESKYSRLVFPAAVEFSVPIKPGIFKATMGLTGIRLVILSYPDENTAEGLTISGGRMSGSGVGCFKADLRYCIHLDSVSQSHEQLCQMEPALSHDIWSDLPTPQPFIIPQQCQHPLVPNAPNQCLARFYGTNDILGPSVQSANPFNVGHWIVFNEDLFGFLSPGCVDATGLFTLFHRVQDPALQVTSFKS